MSLDNLSEALLKREEEAQQNTEVTRRHRKRTENVKRFLSMSEENENMITASNLLEPGGFRRDYLIRNTLRRGVTYRAMPHTWKVPLLRQLEEISLLELAEMLGGEYKLKEGSSDILTFFSLMKSMITIGILFVPRGFMLGGWLFAALAFLMFSCICTTCMIWLSNAKHVHGGTYSDLCGLAMGNVGYYMVELSIFVVQIGFGVVSIVFFNQNFTKIVYFFGAEVDLWVPSVIQLVLVSPFSLIKEMTDIAITHIFADIAIFINLIYIIAVAILNIVDQGAVEETVQAFNPETFMLMLGMAIYSFEGITLVIPIKSAMKNQQNFNRILITVMAIVTCMLIGFGIVNYFSWGTHTAQIATLNVKETMASSILLLVYLVAVLLTFPLLLFPPFAMIDNWTGEKVPEMVSNFIRLSITALIVVAGYFLNDKADKYVSLLGSVLCAPLAYIYPSIVNICLNRDSSLFGKILSWVFVVLGILAAVYTFKIAIENW